MKKLPLFLLAALLTATGYAADLVPLFNATLSMGKDQRFVLVSPAGKSSSWLKLGDVFEGYTVKAYTAASNTLDLEKDGKIFQAHLVGDTTTVNAPIPTKATLADAEELFRVMRFDEMMKKILDGQKKGMAPMMQQQIAQGLARGNLNLSEEDRAAVIAMQNKVLDDTLGVITGPEMRKAMASIYSEVFTKDELNSMSAFYSTPGGQALTDKQPEVQQKMMTVMMPMIMQNQQSGQQQMRDFMAGLKTKYSTGGGAAGATPAPSPAPAPAAKP